MRIGEVMCRPVRTLRKRASLAEAAAALVDRGFTAIPVIDDAGHLVGMVTDADVLKGRESTADTAGSVDAASGRASVTVGEIMTTPVATLTPQSDVDDAARVMVEEKVGAVPIVEGSTLVGIVTRRDVLRAAAAPSRPSRTTSSHRCPSPMDCFDW